MDNKNLIELRDIAFEITIDPNNDLHAANAEDVVKVLSAYISSYKSFLKIKLKADNFSDAQILEVVNETQLLVVNTEFNSYHNSFAPYNPNSNEIIPLFKDYKKDILESDMDNFSDMLQLRNDFTKEQLYSIYNPIFSVVSKSYSLKVKTEEGKEKKVVKPRKEFATYFKPVKPKFLDKDEDKLFQIFLQSPDLKNISKKDIIYSSELKHQIYPYLIDRIIFNNQIIYFNDSITCEVSFEENLYFISYSDLKIEVWGQSRIEAEDAFNFTFYSLYINYAKEDDENLSNDAIQLKNKITTMIRLVK